MAGFDSTVNDNCEHNVFSKPEEVMETGCCKQEYKVGIALITTTN